MTELETRTEDRKLKSNFEWPLSCYLRLQYTRMPFAIPVRVGHCLMSFKLLCKYNFSHIHWKIIVADAILIILEW